MKFYFVLMDSWCASVEISISAMKRHFIAALKDNRLIALTEEDRKNEQHTRVDDLNFSEQTAMRGWLKDYAHEVLMGR